MSNFLIRLKPFRKLICLLILNPLDIVMINLRILTSNVYSGLVKRQSRIVIPPPPSPSSYFPPEIDQILKLSCTVVVKCSHKSEKRISLAEHNRTLHVALSIHVNDAAGAGL